MVYGSVMSHGRALSRFLLEHNASEFFLDFSGGDCLRNNGNRSAAGMQTEVTRSGSAEQDRHKSPDHRLDRNTLVAYRDGASDALAISRSVEANAHTQRPPAAETSETR